MQFTFRVLAKFLLTFSIVAASAPSSAVTTRTADIAVKNNTGKHIVSLKVVHKYSTKFNIVLSTENIRKGTTAKSFKKNCYGRLDGGQLVEITTEPCKLRYNTGFGTTGRDWWLVSWSYFDDEKVYYTKPKNFRKAIDKLENASDVIIAGAVITAASAVTIVCTAATAGVCGGPAAIGMASALTAIGTGGVGYFTGKMLNSESTAGFKQHILEDEDKNKVTTITLNADGTVVFVSSSGTSNTIYTSRDPDISEQEKRAITENSFEGLIAKEWFTKKNAGIPGFNKVIKSGISVNECKVRCEEASWCLSIDYKREAETCYLQDASSVGKNAQKLKTDYKSNPYDHYWFDSSAKQKTPR